MRKNRTKRRRTRRRQRGGFSLSDLNPFNWFGNNKQRPVAGQPVAPPTSPEPVTSELSPSNGEPSLPNGELPPASQAGGRRRKHKRKSKKHKRKTRRTRKKRRSRRRR